MLENMGLKVLSEHPYEMHVGDTAIVIQDFEVQPAGRLDFDLDTVRAAMGSVDGVAGVHDLHVWSVAGDDASLTAHIVLAAGADPEALRGAVAAMLGTQFNIQHSTIQTETVACGDEDAIHA